MDRLTQLEQAIKEFKPYAETLSRSINEPATDDDGDPIDFTYNDLADREAFNKLMKALYPK